MDIKKLTEETILKNMTPEQQKAVLESVMASVKESKQVRTQKIAENVDLVMQALKKIEAQMLARLNKAADTVETVAKNVKDGKDGRDGKDGKDGKGLVGPKGADGRDGKDGKDGKDGRDGVDGVSVVNAFLDFDNSLVIELSNGKQINVGGMLSDDAAEKVRVVANGGGTSQGVLDAIAALQTAIATLIPSQTGNAGKFLTTDGSTTSWASVGGGLSYQGTWNASTNSPTLTSSVGTNGYYYVVGTAGSTNLNGVTDWQVGDWVIFSGTTWQKIDQTNLVTSVAGRTGAVTLSTSDISGLGTIATQAANNVAITGGAIDGTIIGSTTPAAGTFTTLNTTGLTTLKNSSGTYVAVMDDGGVSDRYAFVRDTGGGAYIRFNSGNGGLRSAGTGGIFIQTNNGSQTQFGVSHTASAVNYVQVTGAATTSQPIISAQGSDTNVGLLYRVKGVGSHYFQTGGGSINFEVLASGGGNANYLRATGASTTATPSLSAQGGDTNIDLALTTKGTGSVVMNTGNGAQFKVLDNGATATTAITAKGGINGGNAQLYLSGTGNTEFWLSSLGTGAVKLQTNAGAQEQLRIAHTASAVNYVQVTGAATGNTPAISAQGSDSNINLLVNPKGTGAFSVFANSGTQFRVSSVASAINYIQATGSLTGVAPSFSSQGTDTNIDLALTPKGTGVVQFGSYTATGSSTFSIAGYITIKDSSGTLRNLAVIA